MFTKRNRDIKVMQKANCKYILFLHEKPVSGLIFSQVIMDLWQIQNIVYSNIHLFDLWIVKINWIYIHVRNES